MGKLPFWFYKYMTIIIKKGGYPLLVFIGGLIAQGSIKTVKDLKSYIDKE